MVLDGASDPAAAARRSAIQELGEFGGVVAWTDVEAGLTDDQRVRLVATGWFEDLARVVVEEQGSQAALFQVERQGDVMTVRLRQDEGSGAPHRQDVVTRTGQTDPG